MSLFRILFGWFVSPLGLVALAALNGSPFFYAPFADDAVIVFLVARDRDLFWLYPLLGVIGGVAGNAVSYWVGAKIDKNGLDRWVRASILDRVRRKVEGGKAAVGLAIPAIIPPPFPFTAVALAAGALRVAPAPFFGTFALLRLVRYGAEAVLALYFGRRLVSWMQSDAFRIVIFAFILVAIAGTAYSIWRAVARARTVSAGGRRGRTKAA